MKKKFLVLSSPPKRLRRHVEIFFFHSHFHLKSKKSRPKLLSVDIHTLGRVTSKMIFEAASTVFTEFHHMYVFSQDAE